MKKQNKYHKEITHQIRILYNPKYREKVIKKLIKRE